MTFSLPPDFCVGEIFSQRTVRSDEQPWGTVRGWWVVNVRRVGQQVNPRGHTAVLPQSNLTSHANR